MDRVNAATLMLVTPEYADIKLKRAKSAYQPLEPTIPILYPLPMKRDTIDGISIRYAHEPAEGKPTLIFWGEDDHLLKLDNAELLKGRMPNSTLHVFKDCGHFSYQDAHTEFQKMVVDWIQNHG